MTPHVGASGLSGVEFGLFGLVVPEPPGSTVHVLFEQTVPSQSVVIEKPCSVGVTGGGVVGVVALAHTNTVLSRLHELPAHVFHLHLEPTFVHDSPVGFSLGHVCMFKRTFELLAGERWNPLPEGPHARSEVSLLTNTHSPMPVPPVAVPLPVFGLPVQ